MLLLRWPRRPAARAHVRESGLRRRALEFHDLSLTASRCRTAAISGTISFNISLAPLGDSREEGGVYVQDRDFPFHRTFDGSSGTRIDLFTAGQGRAVAAHGVYGQAAAEPDDSFLLQSCVSGPIVLQQLPADAVSDPDRSRRTGRPVHVPDRSPTETWTSKRRGLPRTKSATSVNSAQSRSAPRRT